MPSDTKFHTLMSPEADGHLDAMSEQARETALTFVSEQLPNIRRRDAVMKSSTPMGTLFNFAASDSVIVTCLNGHAQDGSRIMIIVGFTEVVR